MIGSLTARIFAIFWLTLALVLMLVLMLPKLDSRQMTELLESEQRQGVSQKMAKMRAVKLPIMKRKPSDTRGHAAF